MKPHALPLEPTEAEISHAAYLLWEEHGRPVGRDLEFWLSAQERLRHTVPAHRRWRWTSPALHAASNAQSPVRKSR
jgi:hypothetical protein